MALAGHDLLDPLVDRARAHQPVGHHGAGLADAPRPVAGLVLDRGFHQRSYSTTWLAAVRFRPVPPALSDSTSARPLAALELGDELVAGAAGQAAVVAGDGHAGDLGEVVGQPLAPLGEVGEHEDALAGGEHRLDDLLQPG